MLKRLISVMFNIRIMPKVPICPDCGRYLKRTPYINGVFRCAWICRNKKCNLLIEKQNVMYPVIEKGGSQVVTR